MIKSLLHNNATIINGEWRFMFNKSNNEVGNCDIFKNLSLNNQNFVGQSSKEYIKIDHYRILKRTNLEGKKFTDCLLKYPRSINFQKFCLEQLGLTLINDIANALKNQEKNEATVIAYCIPKDYLHSIDKIYLLQAIGKHTLTIKSNVIDYFINYPIEITNQYSNCTFFEHFIKTYTIFNEKDKKKQKNRLKDVRHIKEELDKMCF